MIHDRSRIELIEIEDVLKKAYLEYSMSVIVSRALPDVRDGLKPSQRRILYAMNELNLTPGRGFRKCAKIAGDTSGNYHPHGEQVIYPTMVRMAQPWSLRYMLVDGQGNFGSQDGDPPAAMRYTEARLQKASVDLMEDLDKETVDFQTNYDDTRQEPTVFPSKFPNLMVNGSSGIAVGMATNMAPHNVSEVCDGIIAYIENPDMEAMDFLKYIKGPDFPTGGYIIGKQGIKDYFQTGHGRVIMRGKAAVETKNNGMEMIVITEIPYMLNKTLLIDKIVSLVKDKKVEGISDIRDESGRQGMRLVITVKRNAEASTVLNKLYKYSQLQTSFSVNNRALVGGIPQVINIKDMVQNFVDFRHEVVVRRTQYELKNAEHRLHILEGYRIALDNIDDIIKTIRASKTTTEASENLQEKFKLSEIQAKAILDMRLQKLTGLEREKVEEEYNKLVKFVAKLKNILEKKHLRMNIIKRETNEIKEKYKDLRRTTILEGNADIDTEDMIADEEMVVTISHSGYIKRLPIATYRKQGRGGKGLAGSNLKDDDFVESIFVASTHAYILFFTNFGKCYWLKVHRIPNVGRLARGKAIVNLLQLEKDEKIEAFVTARDFEQPHYVTMVTKKGTVKKSELNAFSRPRVNGIIAIKLIEGDRLIDAKITEGDNDILLATSHGYANRFHESDARSMGRNSQGVRGIRLREGDEVVSMVVIKREGTLLAISENGYGKRTEISDYKVTKRGSKGVITLKTTKRNGNLVALLEVVDNDDLMIVTREGMIIRQAVDRISVIGRNTQGVKLIGLNKGDQVYDLARIFAEDEEEEEILENVFETDKEATDSEETTEETTSDDSAEESDMEEDELIDSEEDKETEPEEDSEESDETEEEKPKKRGRKPKNEELTLDFDLDE
ncbi:MAG: DNA gyrase subunit A [Candidatus Cloacimonetes bacterium]|nr:DNA gyrase subunit A [Candidatus Cloacimonadota bacterium]MCF7813913.1 DNA gyrase subunit A [Candidatus Cloacimonadota bacterium]MCF7868510.1 DNA gyrase subunit A [Candidatus Cloacimonadota bacterium]MCF7884025.1 DNA gyrase subunit A [Candidatus Cloacimonadota bacterium]